MINRTQNVNLVQKLSSLSKDTPKVNSFQQEVDFVFGTLL